MNVMPALPRTIKDPATRVRESLNQSGFKQLRSIEVTPVENGVLLSGKVQSYYLKQIAQSLAMSTARETPVNNAIEVPGGSPLGRRVPRPHQATNQPANYAVEESLSYLLATAIARLSDDDLNRMSREDLMDVVRIAAARLPQQSLPLVPSMTTDQLRRLAFLARRSCRLQTRPGR